MYCFFYTGRAADSTATTAVHKSTILGSFYHLPTYLKLYDALRATHANYKVSLQSSVLICLLYIATIVQKFGVRTIFFPFLEEINTLIQRGCIKLIKSDSKDIHNLIEMLFQINAVLLKFVLKNPEKMQHNLCQNWISEMFLKPQISILEFFLMDLE